MKFEKKLELAQKLKTTVTILPFSAEKEQDRKIAEIASMYRNLYQRTVSGSICDSATVISEDAEDFRKVVAKLDKMKIDPEKRIVSSGRATDEDVEAFRQKQESYKKIAKQLKDVRDGGADTSKDRSAPGIIDDYCPPCPAETKVIIDGYLMDNVYSVDYAYLYSVDDRTPEEVIMGVPADEYHVVGWITIMFLSPADAATFDANEIRLYNVNDRGQVLDLSIVDVHPVAEVSGVTMGDVLMSKTIYFEAKDLVGRVSA